VGLWWGLDSSPRIHHAAVFGHWTRFGYFKPNSLSLEYRCEKMGSVGPINLTWGGFDCWNASTDLWCHSDKFSSCAIFLLQRHFCNQKFQPLLVPFQKLISSSEAYQLYQHVKCYPIATGIFLRILLTNIHRRR